MVTKSNPKHTDTSRSGDLVERLRERTCVVFNSPGVHPDTECLEAADRIEALEAENARLREAVGILEDGLQEVGDDYPGSSCQEWCQHQIKQARAALKEIEGD